MAVETGRHPGRAAFWFCAWMVALCASFFLWRSPEFGTGRTITAALVTVSAPAAIALGVSIHRPVRRLPWLLLAGAVFTHALARVAYGLLGLVNPLDRNGARAAPEYLLHAASTVLLVAAFLLFARNRGRRPEWLVLVDVAIVVLGVGLLVWVFGMQPLMGFPEPHVSTFLIRGGYLIRDLVILAAVARFAAVVRWNPSAVLLTVGTLGLVGYGMLLRLQAFAQGLLAWGGLYEVLWFLFFAALGLAALVPSMSRVGTRDEQADGNTVTSLVMVGVAALIPFAVLLGYPEEHRRGETEALHVAAAMLALVLVRLTVGALRLRRSLNQSRAVGEASARLVSAADVPAIESAVDTAAGLFFGSRSAYSVRLRLDEAPLVGEAPGAAPEPPPAGRAELRIPLTVPPGPAGTPGDLVASAPAPALAQTRHAMEVLAAQASLALARVRLTDEVHSTRRDEYFRALVQNSTDVILIVERDGRIRYASPSAEKMFEMSTVESRPLPALLDPADRAAAERLLADIYSGAADGAGTIRTDWRFGPDGQRRAEVSCLDLRGEAAIRGIVVTLRDVTDQRRLEERLTMQAFYDPLTGVGNRSLFTTGVESAMLTPRDATFAAVLFIDLDDFKAINDGYGHAVGDALLQEVARRITATVEPYGLAARVGGDEFAVLVSNALEPAEVDDAADRLVRTLGRPAVVHGERVRCGASVGVATTLDADTADELLRHADLALYEAKGTGKRQWRRYNQAMRHAPTERLALRTMLTDAFASDELRVEFQPIVALPGGRTVGFEALVRWEHPSRGRVPASEFIECAEDSGLILEIGEWVLGTAAREAVRWSRADPTHPLFVSVNVSPRQLESADTFVDMVRRQLAEAGLPANRLILEITERVLITDNAAAVSALAQLRELGIRVAIDDFGTGYSALGYLQGVPLDLVKLDRVFIHHPAPSAQQRDLIASIVRLATTLHLEVVAEGVETDQERDLAVAAGCAYGQGFRFSRPLPPADALRWVDRNQSTVDSATPRS